MTIYTVLPLEVVLDGARNEPAPLLETTIDGMTVQLAPVAPGIGRIVRLVNAPLDRYLMPQYEPGRTIRYAPQPDPPASDSALPAWPGTGAGTGLG
ncbi:YlzJ-like family protein [Paenibacillaceae bacterium WGS1546]|uniref:YlzJ-like family protein n=1 Tax=Cohnella sp. WGS1546 TaxID=3366810 RepID=UPI00372D0D4D